MKWKQSPLLLLICLAAPAAHADSTIYNVNFNVGAANATGTITTNGNLGVLTTSDILGFNLNLSDGTITQSLVNKNAGVFGNQFTATTAGLFFDFSNSSAPNYAGFVDNLGAAQQMLCFTGSGNCAGSLGSQAVLRVNGQTFTAAERGTVEVATFPGASTVTPEPSSLALLGTGLIGVYGVARRRFA